MKNNNSLFDFSNKQGRSPLVVPLSVVNELIAIGSPLKHIIIHGNEQENIAQILANGALLRP